MSNKELTVYHTYKFYNQTQSNNSLLGSVVICDDEPSWWKKLILSEQHNITTLKKYLKDEYGCNICTFSKPFDIKTDNGSPLDCTQIRTYLKFRSVSEKFRFVLEHV